ncbi:MAG: hypothetical protein ACTSRH_04200 [Promethearchaeota archaeon]
MRELNNLIDNLRKENIESLTHDIIHKGFYFGTWKDKLLHEK